MKTNTLKIKNTNLQRVDEGVSCLITKDLMNCILFFTRAMNGGKKLSLEDIKQTLTCADVSFGIDDQLILSLENHREYDYKYVVASGKPPIHGINAKIIPQIHIASTSEKTTHNFGDTVATGAILATKESLVPGVDGITVTGIPIHHLEAKDVAFKVGQNVQVDLTGENLISTCAGHLIITNGYYSIVPDDSKQQIGY